MVKKVSGNEFKELASKGISVVDFSAVWCGPCKMLAPVLEQVSEEMPEVQFFNIDVDDNMDIAQEYRITNIPAVLMFKDGALVNTSVGFQPKAALMEFIKGNM